MNSNHFNRLKSLIPSRVFYGGDSDEDNLKISPTIIEVEKVYQVMNDAIFGPILPILELESLESGIDFIKSKEKLTSTLFVY